MGLEQATRSRGGGGVETVALRAGLPGSDGLALGPPLASGTLQWPSRTSVSHLQVGRMGLKQRPGPSQCGRIWELQLRAAGRRCGYGEVLRLRAAGRRYGAGGGAWSSGARRTYRKWRLHRADGGGCSGGDDGFGLCGGWGGPLPLPLPRLPGRRAARGLRGLLLRGARHRHPDVSPASRPEPGAGPWLARERADRWAGPGARGDALAGIPGGLGAEGTSLRGEAAGSYRGRVWRSRGQLGLSASESESQLRSRLARSPVPALASRSWQPVLPAVQAGSLCVFPQHRAWSTLCTTSPFSTQRGVISKEPRRTSPRWKLCRDFPLLSA